MTISITAVVDSPPELEVVAGVDTHADAHDVAVLSTTGARLGDLQVPATTTGYDQLPAFIRPFGSTRLVGIEGSSSYGAGLARYLMSHGVESREVVRPRRAQRRHGKSDPIDAYAAAVQALSKPETLPMAKTGAGIIEQIRVLMGVRRSTIKARVAVIRQIKSMLVTAPEEIRTRLEGLNGRCLVESLASIRPGPATGSEITATGHALRRLAHRHQYLTVEITELEEELRSPVGRSAPSMIETKGYGVITTAILLVTAGANPERLRSEASFAARCGASPIPASSGKTNRYRLNRAGDRQANWARHQIALVRLSNDERTRSYAARLRANGKSKKDVLRCLKRAIAWETFHLIVHPEPVPATEDLRDLRHHEEPLWPRPR